MVTPQVCQRPREKLGGLSTVRKVGILIAGWVLVIAGVIALVIPGPGLLLLLGGLVLLSTEYAWAKARVEPVQKRAVRTAAESVQSMPRIVASIASALGLIAVGVLWGLDPRIPEFGPFDPQLPFGGWATGITLIVSGLVALALVIVSIRRFREPSDSATDSATGSTREPHSPSHGRTPTHSTNRQNNEEES